MSVQVDSSELCWDKLLWAMPALVEESTGRPLFDSKAVDGGARVVIGRRDIASPSKEQQSFISRAHASVCYNGTNIVIEDNQTANGDVSLT